MNFNKHLELTGSHAFLSASKPAWVNYDDEKFDLVYSNHRAAQLGTELHEFAATAIRLKQKLQSTRKTLNSFVNDAISYRMTPEQILFYSYNAYGTADAISFKKDLLRIHDLKNGTNPASMRQLEIYAAFFCLEYGYRPSDIGMELRIYQNDDIKIHFPEFEVIDHIMERVISRSKRIDVLRLEG